MHTGPVGLGRSIELSYRILVLPSFKGSKSTAIKDPFEFLGKFKVLLEAHEVLQYGWYSELLATLNRFDGQSAESDLVGKLAGPASEVASPLRVSCDQRQADSLPHEDFPQAFGVCAGI